MLPLAFNIHFIITFGFWISISFFEMKELDTIEHDEIVPIFHNIHAVLNHSISFMILFYQNMKGSYEFNDDSLSNSFLWLYSWLVFIYIPWRTLTGDMVYSMLDTRKSMMIPILIYVIIHFSIYFSNELGKNTSGLLKS